MISCLPLVFPFIIFRLLLPPVHGAVFQSMHFCLPVYDESGEAERYNVFHVSRLKRYDADGKILNSCNVFKLISIYI